jgi:DNA-binding transcriptional LysR family regulator
MAEGVTGTTPDLRLLGPFLALVEERSFTRAAQRLNIAQPALSQQIKRLETQMGVDLFERTARGVRLTPAGERLSASVYPAFEELRRGVSEAQAMSQERVVEIRVAYISSLGSDVVPRIVRILSQTRPRFRLRLRVMSLDEQLSALRACAVDVGLFRLPDHVEVDLRQLHVVEIARCRRYVLLPSHHPLACMMELDLSALAGERWIMPSGTYQANLIAACRSVGFEPRIAQEANSFDAMVGLVRAGLGICISVSSGEPAEVPGLTAVPLRGTPVALVTGWAGTPDRSLLSAFIDVARSTTRVPQSALTS